MPSEVDEDSSTAGPLLGALVGILAVQQAALAALIAFDVPVHVVRGLRFSKEALLVVLCLLAAREVARNRVTPDAVDFAAAAFLAMAGVYLLLGLLVTDLFPGVTRDVWLHLVGFRSLASAPIVLLAVRSLRLSMRTRCRIGTVIVAVAVLSALVASGQMVAPEAWLALADRIFAYDAYQQAVFGRDLPDGVLTRTSLPGATVVRAGGLMFDHLQLGFFLLPGFAVALARTVREEGRDRAIWGVALTAVVVGMVATGTRSALLSASAAGGLLVITWPETGQRRRATAVAAAAAAGVVALAIPTGMATRMVAGLLASDASSADRLGSLALGVETVMARPLGLGIASTAETAPRSEGIGLVVENAYLDMAVQIGVVGAALFVVLLLVLGGALWRRRTVDPLALPALAVLLGVAVGSMFLPVWLMFETTWQALAFAGLPLQRREAAPEERLPCPLTWDQEGIRR